MPPAVRRFHPGALRAATDRFAAGGFSFSRTCFPLTRDPSPAAWRGEKESSPTPLPQKGRGEKDSRQRARESIQD
jgi:hypothetical protein